MPLPLDFHARNPFRPPQWRSERAILLADRQPRPLRPRRFDDAYIRTYWQFLVDYVRTREHPERSHALFLRQPHVYHAHMVQWHPDPEWKTILEARLLTGANYAEIANGLNLDPAVVNWYEKLFFNVREKLHHRDWIVKTITGSPADRAANKSDTMTDLQRDMVYKLFAYLGGPLVLDAIICGFNGLDFPAKAADIPEWFDAALANLVRVRAAVAARLFEINRYNVMQLLEINFNLQNMKSADATGPQTAIEQNLDVIIQELGWEMAPTLADQRTGAMSEYMTSAVEANAREQLQLAAGEVPQRLLEDANRAKNSRIFQSPAETEVPMVAVTE